MDRVQADRLVEDAGAERQRLEVAGSGLDRAAVDLPRAADAQHVDGDVDSDRPTVQPRQQVRTPAAARSEIQDQIGGRRTERQHRHGEVMEQLRAVGERIGARL
jgi:hypothetical protein